MSDWERAFDEWLRSAAEAWEGRIDHGNLINEYMWDKLEKGRHILEWSPLGESEGENANEDED